MSDEMNNPESNQAMILGELRGQVRELIHSVNNLTMNVTGLSREVSALGALGTSIADMQARLAILEANYNRREGASGVWSAIAKSPAFGWMVGWLVSAAIAIWAIFGKSANQ